MKYARMIRFVSGLVLVLAMMSFPGCDLLFGSEDDGRDPLPAATSVSDSDGNTYTVGYDQVTPTDQDPFVRKTNGSGTQLWRLRHDETPVDARAVAIALDASDRPYVIFSTDGGSSDSDRFQTHRVEGTPFSGAPFNSYGSGGGPKVSIIARLDPATGEIERATYLRARLNSGNTNTLNATGIAVSGSSVLVDVESSAWPPAAGATASNWIRFDETQFNDATRPALRYTLNADLTAITDAVVR